jgi:hypothetical protein
MTKDFCTQLQWLAGCVWAVGLGVQNRATVAKACDALAVEQVRVYSSHLGGGVSTQAHHAARDLIDQLEGLQVKGFASACEQGLNVLKQRRGHQLKAIASGCV